MLPDADAKVFPVAGITPTQEQRILDFLQGVVYAQCANAPDKWFSVRSFLGGGRFEWSDTPLQTLYESHIASGKSANDANTSAKKDAGMLFKKVLANEPNREFETQTIDSGKGFNFKEYRWLRREPTKE